MARVQRARKAGERMSALEAVWRCCAMESAISLRAAALSAWVVRTVVVRGGAASRGGLEGARGASSEAARRGVEVCDDIAECGVVGRARLARREVKKAGGRG